MNCQKKGEIIAVKIYCDLESIEKDQMQSLSLCKKCLIDFAKKNLIMISLYSLTRKSVFKLLDKSDLSEGGKSSLEEMQTILKKESEYHIRSFIASCDL